MRNLIQYKKHAFLAAVIAGIMLSAFLLTIIMSTIPDLDLIAKIPIGSSRSSTSTSSNGTPSTSTNNSTGPQPTISPSPSPSSPSTMPSSSINPTPTNNPLPTTSLTPSPSPSPSIAQFNTTFMNPQIPAEGGECDSSTYLEIFGKTQTSYIRTKVGETYQNRQWSLDQNAEITPYNGSYIPQELSQYSSKTRSSVIIKVSKEWSGFIPALVYSNKINLAQNLPTQYYPKQYVFSVQTQFTNAYMNEYTHYEFNENMLGATRVDSESAPALLAVPDGLKPTLQEIIGRIGLSQALSDYSRIMLIRDYLRANYVYDLNYTRAPSNQDPVQWFLLNQKRGVCSNFNSAFVLLLRSVGIPSRMVAGFGINPNDEYQNVTGKQSHAWAEVKFRTFGWVEFDATAAGSDANPIFSPTPNKSTKTEITSLSPSALKGGPFFADGSVTDSNGNPVGGLKVTISLKANKNDDLGFVSGLTTTASSGYFSLTCEIPSSVNVGNYNVIAKTIGNSVYLGSESDPILKVNAQTEIALNTTGNATVNVPFSVFAQLTENETKIPIADANLTLSYIIQGQEKQVFVTTNQSGYAMIPLEVIAQTNDSYINYTVSFDQSGFYLSSQTNGQLNISQLSSVTSPVQTSSFTPSMSISPSPESDQSNFFSFTLLLIIILTVGLSSGIVAFIFYRRRKHQNLVDTKPTMQRPISNTLIAQAKNSDNLALTIVFPSINTPFPDVWGVSERLKVEFHLAKNGSPVLGDISAQVENGPVKDLRTDVNGVAKIDFQTNTKGTYLLIAKHLQNNSTKLIANRNIRIVDYTEEAVAIFKETFNIQKNRGLPIDQETSPREFQNILLKTLSSETKVPMEQLVSIFEIADYSLHNIGRTEYEKMFLASLSLKEEPRKMGA